MKAKMKSKSTLELTFEERRVNGTMPCTREICIESCVRNRICLRAETNPSNFNRDLEYTLTLNYDLLFMSPNYEKFVIPKSEYEEIGEFVNRFPLSLCPLVARAVRNPIMELEV